MFAAKTLFAASVCGIPKLEELLKEPETTLNNNAVELADNNVPENPPDCVNTAPSINVAGIVGEPVKLTLNA